MVLKILCVLLSIPVAFTYGTIFSYFGLVWFYIFCLSSFVLLTLPCWYTWLAGAFPARWILYYVCVISVLFVAAMGRFVLEGAMQGAGVIG